MKNHIKTMLLFFVLTFVLMLIGNLVGGIYGMLFALIFAIVTNFFSYWFSDKIVLKIYKAQEATHMQFPTIYKILKNLSYRANMPIPKLYVIDQISPNAFATGRNSKNSVIALTKGLIDIMNEEELTGILAHELAHIKNKDILIGTIIATIAGAIMSIATIAQWSLLFSSNTVDDENDNGIGMIGIVVMAIIAPIAATIIQMAISRTREYLADSTGANIVGNPKGLASALKKLDKYANKVNMKATPSTAHMFIINPLSGVSFQNLFSTHPLISNRIKRLID